MSKSNYIEIQKHLCYLDNQIEELKKCEKFRYLYEKFIRDQNVKHYLKLQLFLRKIFKLKFKFFFKNSKSSLIFIDDNGIVIWNSYLDDTYGNNFQNYLDGKISIQNIYQFQCSSQAQQTGKAQVIKSVKKNGKFSNFAFVSRKVGSTLTSGFSSSNDGCWFCL